MRPKSLVWFDVFALLALALYVARTGFTLLQLQAAIAAQPGGEPYTLAIAASISTVIIGAGLLVWFMASRRRKPSALWLWVGIAVFSLMGLPKTMQAFLAGQLVVADVLYDVLYFGALLASVVALLRPSSRAWIEVGRKD